MAERFISVKQVLDRICLSKTELYERMKAGTFPRSVALGPQKVVFLESEIDAWMIAQVEASGQSGDARRIRAQKAVGSRKDRHPQT
jgi:prophage regulatory protein